jgi:peptidoglycan hydrolase CwlO-like protein
MDAAMVGWPWPSRREVNSDQILMQSEIDELKKEIGGLKLRIQELEKELEKSNMLWRGWEF